MLGKAITDPLQLLDCSEKEQDFYIEKMKQRNPDMKEHKVINCVTFIKNKIIYNDLLKLIIRRN